LRRELEREVDVGVSALELAAATRLGRREVDAVFRALPVVVFPSTRKPMIRTSDYLEPVEQSSYRGDRVRL
jgi:hypothetical protein